MLENLNYSTDLRPLIKSSENLYLIIEYITTCLNKASKHNYAKLGKAHPDFQVTVDSVGPLVPGYFFFS